MNTNPSNMPRAGAPDDDDRERLVELALAGDATPEQTARLRAVLRADAAMLDAYLDQVRAHALLEWRSGKVSAGAVGDEVGDPAHVDRMRIDRAIARPKAVWRPRAWAAAAAVLLAASVVFVVVRRSAPTPSQPSVAFEPVADVAEVLDVVWADGQAPLAVGTAVGPGELGIASGTLRLNVRGDAVVTLAGPGRVRLVSASRLQAVAGRITARVGPAGKGFVVDAPGAEVVDLGTEFGVQVGPGSETAVVVFDGAVDLTPKPVATPPAVPVMRPAEAASGPPRVATRLVGGQAVRVTPGGTMDRVVFVSRRPGAADWSLAAGDPGAVIAAVRDNRRDSTDARYYQIVRNGFTEDARAYVDRSYEWNGVDRLGLPEALSGGDLVMAFNDDKHAADLELTVTLARPARLYVLYKKTPVPIPDWLTRDFIDTGWTVGLDEGPPDMRELRIGVGPGESIDHVFGVWQSNAPVAGDVKLGANSRQHNSMYGIVAAPLP